MWCMEKVKSRAINMMYGISKIHTNVEFTFSNNTTWLFPPIHIDKRQILMYNQDGIFVVADITIVPSKELYVNG